jgi:hypothetical protein
MVRDTILRALMARAEDPRALELALHKELADFFELAPEAWCALATASICPLEFSAGRRSKGVLPAVCSWPMVFLSQAQAA